VLITGDALLTANARSLCGPLPGQQMISGPPRISTWNWAAATESVARLAGLEPRVLAPGHGTPMTTAATALRCFAGRLASGPRVAPGFVSLSTTAARPGIAGPRYVPALRPRGTLLTAAGISPDYVITLEIPSRRSGLIRRTALVRVARDGGHYLVALAGESEWVRNVRAADGRVVSGLPSSGPTCCGPASGPAPGP